MSLLEDVRIAEAYERVVEKEEINEILRLKPEAAKAAAQKKLQQISDDIKKAIKKFGEDSKTVLYMRAKKKRMQDQFAHAMGESISEGIKVDKLGPEAKKAFNAMQSGKAKKIGVDPFDKNKMYWDVNGTAWMSTMNSLSNMGDTKKFVADVKAKKFKVKLHEEKKECPEGHEWDEKMQECLPSSTGIKEEKKDCPEGHEWDEKMQECLPSSTGIKEEVIADKEIKNAFNQWKKSHKEGSVDDFIKALKVDTGASKKAENAARYILQMDAFRGIRNKDLIVAYVARIIDREMK